MVSQVIGRNPWPMASIKEARQSTWVLAWQENDFLSWMGSRRNLIKGRLVTLKLVINSQSILNKNCRILNNSSDFEGVIEFWSNHRILNKSSNFEQIVEFLTNYRVVNQFWIVSTTLTAIHSLIQKLNSKETLQKPIARLLLPMHYTIVFAFQKWKKKKEKKKNRWNLRENEWKAKLKKKIKFR